MLNQCDGCRIRAPFTRRGHHKYPDGSIMACTKDKYKDDVIDAAAALVGAKEVYETARAYEKLIATLAILKGKGHVHTQVDPVPHSKGGQDDAG